MEVVGPTVPPLHPCRVIHGRFRIGHAGTLQDHYQVVVAERGAQHPVPAAVPHSDAAATHPGGRMHNKQCAAHFTSMTPS